MDSHRFGSGFNRDHEHKVIRHADTLRDKASKNRSNDKAAVASGVKKTKKSAATFKVQLDGTAGAASDSKRGKHSRAASGNHAPSGSKTGQEPATVPYKLKKGAKAINTTDSGINQDNILKTQLRGQSLAKSTPDQKAAKKTATQTNSSKKASPGGAALTPRPTNVVTVSSPSSLSAKTQSALAVSPSVTESQYALFQDEVKALRKETARKRGKMETWQKSTQNFCTSSSAWCGLGQYGSLITKASAAVSIPSLSMSIDRH